MHPCLQLLSGLKNSSCDCWNLLSVIVLVKKRDKQLHKGGILRNALHHCNTSEIEKGLQDPCHLPVVSTAASPSTACNPRPATPSSLLTLGFKVASRPCRRFSSELLTACWSSKLLSCCSSRLRSSSVRAPFSICSVRPALLLGSDFKVTPPAPCRSCYVP